MAKHKETKKTVPVPQPVRNEKPLKVNVLDVQTAMNSINPDIAREGYFIKVRRQHKNPRGNGYMWGYVEGDGFTSEEARDCIPEELVLSRWGAGIYKLNFLTSKKEPIPDADSIDIAVGDTERPDNSNRSFGIDRQTGLRLPSTAKSSTEKIADRIDVQDQKAKVEMAKAELDLMEIEQKKKNLSSPGNENKEVSDLKMQLMMKEMQEGFNKILEKTVTSLKPVDSDKKDNTTEMIMKSMENTNKLMIESMRLQNEQQRASDQKFMDLFLKMNDDKNKPSEKPMSLMDMFAFVTKVDGYRRKNEDEYLPEFVEHPEKEESIIEKIANGVVGFLNKLNDMDPNLISRMFQGAGVGTPQPNPTPDKKFTEAELEEMADEIARDTLKKYKKDNPVKHEKPVIEAEKVPEPADVTDKKNSVNEVLKRILVEIRLKPVELGWMSDAYDNLPDDVLDNVAKAKTDTEILAAISQYADAALIGQLKAELMTGLNPITLTSENILWLAGGVTKLREMIAYGVDENGDIQYPKEPEKK